MANPLDLSTSSVINDNVSIKAVQCHNNTEKWNIKSAFAITSFEGFASCGRFLVHWRPCGHVSEFNHDRVNCLIATTT